MGVLKGSRRGIQAERRRYDLAGGLVAQTYAQKVLGYGPITYWPLWEAVGLTAECLVNSPAQDGTYTGVTLGQPGIGDGNTCPFFDGVSDNVNIYSAAFAAAFSGAAGSITAWSRVFNVGVWTDTIFRYVIHVATPGANNRIILFKRGNPNNEFSLFLESGAVQKRITVTTTETGWFPLGITWDISAGPTGEMRAYIDGAQVGATLVNLGVWVGALDAARTRIGAETAAGLFPWYGWLAHPAVYDYALAPAAMADLAVV